VNDPAMMPSGNLCVRPPTAQIYRMALLMNNGYHEQPQHYDNQDSEQDRRYDFVKG
jgi:hypothetical protein